MTVVLKVCQRCGGRFRYNTDENIPSPCLWCQPQLVDADTMRRIEEKFFHHPLHRCDPRLGIPSSRCLACMENHDPGDEDAHRR